MFDVSSVNQRFFGVTLHVMDEAGEDHALLLQVEPCKMKTLKGFLALQHESGEEVLNKLQDLVLKVLRKNKGRKEVPAEYAEEMTIDELTGLLAAYFGWINKTHKSDPNS